MRKEFSTSWRGSSQARKQRKFVANAHIKIRHELMSSHLSKDLRKKFARRAVPLKKGDTVKVMIGEFKGKTGKIAELNIRTLKVLIEGIQMQKKDGTKIHVVFEPSNLMITELNLEDKKREDSIKKVQASQTKPEVKK